MGVCQTKKQRRRNKYSLPVRPSEPLYENYHVSAHYDQGLSDYNYFFFQDGWFLPGHLQHRVDQEGLTQVALDTLLLFDPEKFIFHYPAYRKD